MPAAGTCLQLLVLALSHGIVALPQLPGAQTILDAPGSKDQSRRLHGRFLHITDFHPDEFYKPHTAVEDGISCHRGQGPAGAYGAEKSECDSPFSLVNATFDWLKQNVKDEIDFILWTGDTARHDSDERHPRNAAEVIHTNRVVADKFVETFSSKNGKLDIPIIPTFGNNDFLPHNIFYPGPNRWLHTYGDVWRRFIPEDQYHSFQFGGWFYVDVIPGKLAVFSLNTMYFFDRNAGVDGCANPHEPGFQHMEWLRVQLQRMRDSGMKAILIGHVPPARTESKKAWDETCWQKYTLWLKQYRDVVAGAVYGHMNIDHFLLQDTHDIDLSVASTESSSSPDISSIDDDVFVQSKGDYLEELRDAWSNLPSAVVRALQKADGDIDDQALGKKHRKKKHKFRKIGGPYAERYQVTLVSPSVVPNYFPTVRIVEYNITGLEMSSVWTDSYDTSSFSQLHSLGSWEEQDRQAAPLREEPKRSIEYPQEIMPERKGKGKGGKHKKPNDPNLIIPDGPPKKSLPGPAYLAQPLTFTGYTQYFANLTYLNNKVPKSSNNDGAKSTSEQLKPRDFTYHVLYSTFDDKIYRLSDLTVKSYLKLAYRIGLAEDAGGKAKHSSYEMAFDDEGDSGDLVENDENEDDDEDLDLDAAGGVDAAEGGKRHRKKKKHRGKKNKVWLHFLRHAFVSSMSEKEIEEF